MLVVSPAIRKTFTTGSTYNTDKLNSANAAHEALGWACHCKFEATELTRRMNVISIVQISPDLALNSATSRA